MAAAAVGGVFSCGNKTSSSSSVASSAGGSAVARPPIKAVRVDADKVAGAWTWAHVTTNKGVRQVETEHWQLAASNGQLMGEYHRDVTVMSLDGTPFTCNQSLSYVLRTKYRLSGELSAKHFELREQSYEVAKSPCERGHRTLGAYRGVVNGDQLVLEWPGGSQSLRRAPNQWAPRTLSTEPTVSGAWQWTNRTESKYRKEARVEREDWQLREKAGVVTGTYLRTVTVFHEKGAKYDCAGASYYRYKDRYTVRGVRKGDRIRLREISVQPDNHNCIAPRKERHLDEARGNIVGDYVVLDWRGRRQVLRRPAETPAQR